MKFKTLLIAAFAAALSCAQANAAATLLPNGEQCFQATVGVNGMVGLLGSITGGTLYTNGTYGGVALTGGSGTGATANITIVGGSVTQIAVLNPGTQYVVGDILSAAAATIGGTGSGFSVAISSTSINSSLAGGTVAFYIPNTSIFKQTWFNADQAPIHQNTNPVSLDANGCAVIYGAGSYRQVLMDSGGNTVWDKITTDTSAGAAIVWAGQATGTPNVITVSAPSFSGGDGQGIQFVALSANTSAVTLNPGTGAVPVTKDTTGGPALLAGGEIQTGNIISVVYSALSGSFQLMNLLPSTANSGIQVGFEISCPGFTAPTNYLFEFGQQVSRGSFNSLMLNLTLSQNAVRTSGNNTLTSISDTSQFAAGMPIEGTGIPGGTTISSTTSSTIVMSANASSSGTNIFTVFPYGNGDGSTTFNLPDRRGVALFGRDNMGGSAKGTLTSTYALVNPDALGSQIGGQSQTLTLAQLPTGITSGSTVGDILQQPAGSTQGFTATTGAQTFVAFSAGSSITSQAITSTSNNTSGSPHTIVPPGTTTNMCLRVL